MDASTLDPAPAPARRPLLNKVREWVWQGHAVKSARAQAKDKTATERFLIDQARALLDLGERVRDRMISVSADSPDHTALVLFHRASLLGLAALSGPEAANPEEAERNSSTTWSDHQAAIFTLAGFTEEESRRASELFPSPLALEPSTVSSRARADADLLQRLAEALLNQLEGSDRVLRHLRWVRFIRTTLVVVFSAVLIVAAITGVEHLAQGKDLLKGIAPTTSSAGPWEPSKYNLLFHTANEKEPWAQFDLKEPKMVKRVVVQNRAEARERAVPLVIELSLDGKKWKEVARRTEDFERWNADFAPERARYIKLTSKKTTFLHLASVKAY